MRGIRLQHGAVFVEHEGVTVRLTADGGCKISPVLLDSLEWELRTEPPDTWEYLSEGEIRNLENGGYEKICAEVARVGKILGKNGQ